MVSFRVSHFKRRFQWHGIISATKAGRGLWLRWGYSSSIKVGVDDIEQFGYVDDAVAVGVNAAQVGPRLGRYYTEWI